MPFGQGFRHRRVHHALPAALQQRLRLVRARNREQHRRVLAEPLARTRLVSIDLETTGPRMDRDQIISIGAIAVSARQVCHADCFEQYLLQARPSAVENILVHQIGGQRQLAGADPAAALVEALEYLGAAPLAAFRAEFDAAVLARALAQILGVRLQNPVLDLAVLLPALCPGSPNDTLEDWLGHFGVPLPGRHEALADAYVHAALLLVVLDRASRAGMRNLRDLLAVQKAQRWLGLRR